MPVLEVCPVCGHKPLETKFDVLDYSVSKQQFTLLQCPGCELMLTTPQPEATDLPKYYASDDYVSHTAKGNNLINRLYLLARQFTLAQKVKLINRYASRGHLLDYGCGTGHFLAEARKDGWKTQGVEPAENVRRSISHSPVFSDLSLVPTPSFPVITLWHVLEHIPDLNEKLQELSSRLEKHGKLFVAVPNYRSFDSELYQQHWAAYDVPRHLWHFTKKTIRTLCLKHQLTLLDVVPMILDSFYVSLLSEQYQTGKRRLPQMINAFNAGLKSNFRARHTGEYSSLIYVITK